MILSNLKVLKTTISCANDNIQINQYLNKFMIIWRTNREAWTEQKQSHKIKGRSSHQSLNIHPLETPLNIQRHLNKLEQSMTTQVNVLVVAEVNSYSFFIFACKQWNLSSSSTSKVRKYIHNYYALQLKNSSWIAALYALSP